MAIKKTTLANGKALYEVFVKTRDHNGRQRALRKRGITSEREAKRIEVELRIQLGTQKARYTWASWVDHFMDYCRLKFRASTIINYEGKLERVVTPIWRDKRLDEVTAKDVHDMIFVHLSHVSGQTQQNYLRTIKRAFALAVEEGVLIKNPASSIKVKKVDSIQGVLNSKEIQILLSEAKSVNHRFFKHWTLALLTGMRSGELYALKWTDVDFDSGFIQVNKSWSRFNGVGPTKSGKNRVVPISGECRKFLSGIKLEADSEEFVLPRLAEWKSGMAAKVLKDFCEGLGITPISFHDLRATFITQLLSNGVPVSKVMVIVGHASLKTTQGYLRLCGQDVIGATEGLNIVVPDDLSSGKVLELKR